MNRMQVRKTVLRKTLSDLFRSSAEKTSLWEVELRSSQYPNYLVTQGIGFTAVPRWDTELFSTGYGIEPSRSFYVRVTGRTSQEASSAASWKHPRILRRFNTKNQQLKKKKVT